MRVLFFICLLCLIFSIKNLSGQPIDIRFRHLTEKNGLSQGTVKSILKDSRGYMWFGTRDGLNRYDGYTFTIFKNNPADPLSISDNFINHIYEDSKGRLWIGTNRGLNLYNRTNNSFTKFLSRDKRFQVTSIIEDLQKKIWLSTYYGLYLYDEANNKFTRFVHSSSKNSLIDDRVNKLTLDKHGNIWIATINGISRFNSNTKTFKNYQLYADKQLYVGRNIASSILVDSADNVWVGFVGSGLGFYDRKNDSFKLMKHDPANSNSCRCNSSHGQSFPACMHTDCSGC